MAVRSSIIVAILTIVSKGLASPTVTGYSQTGVRCKVEAGQPSKNLGSKQPQTLVQCKASCEGNSLCVAFNFKFANGACQLTNAVDLKASVADGVAAGGNGRCDAISCCYSKAQPAPKGYSQTGARCKVEAGQPSNGLGTQLKNKTLHECHASCDGTSLCVAFEFEPATKECELTKAVDLKASVADGVADGGDGRCNADSCCYSKAQPAPTGYSQTGARCKVEAGQPSNGLGAELKGKTLVQCKTACDGNSACVAFDFEPATKQCELAKAVDLKASVADGVADGGDGRCNADSCCYSKDAESQSSKATTMEYSFMCALSMFAFFL